MRRFARTGSAVSVALALWAIGGCLAPAAGAAPGPSVTRTAPSERVAAGIDAPDAPVVLVGGDFLDEGFEGTFPPAGWVRTGNPAVTGNHRWHMEANASYVRTGAQSAAVFWQNALIQDEKFASPPLDLTGAPGKDLRMSFWWFGNAYYAGAADAQVHASSDGVVWTELWRMANETVTGWAWRQKVLDVSSYAGGTLYVRFRYYGSNGADLAVDDVRVGYLGNPSPPPNDDCAGALANGNTIGPGLGAFARTGDNTLATNDYPLAAGSSCTGYAHTGRDMVWVVTMPATSWFAATMTTTGSWDDTLFLVSDCGNVEASCVAGDNGVPDGSRVTTINHNPFSVTYYLIASGYSAGAGEFRLDGALGDGTSVEPSTWGRIKASYR